MKSDELEKERYSLSVQAGMNQRYHQRKAGNWRRVDRCVRVAVGLLAFAATASSIAAAAAAGAAAAGAAAAAAGAAAATQPASTDWGSVSIALGIITAVVGVVLGVVPFSDWESKHEIFLSRWSDIREDIDAIAFVAKQEDRLSAFSRIQAKVHRLCGSEPDPDKKLLYLCFKEEEQSRLPENAPMANPPVSQQNRKLPQPAV